MKRLLFLGLLPAALLVGLTGCPFDEDEQVVPSFGCLYDGYEWDGWNGGNTKAQMDLTTGGAVLTSAGGSYFGASTCSRSLSGDFLIEIEMDQIVLPLPDHPDPLRTDYSYTTDFYVDLRVSDAVFYQYGYQTTNPIAVSFSSSRYEDGRYESSYQSIYRGTSVLEHSESLGNVAPDTWVATIQRTADTVTVSCSLNGQLSAQSKGHTSAAPMTIFLRSYLGNAYTSGAAGSYRITKFEISDLGGPYDFVPFFSDQRWFELLRTEEYIPNSRLIGRVD